MSPKIVEIPPAPAPRSIDRREHLTRLEFERNYCGPGRPVIVTGALANWGALRWCHDFFRTKYSSESVEVMDWANDDFSVRRSTLGDYFRLLARGIEWPNPKRPPYVEAFSLVRSHPELRADLREVEFYRNWFDFVPGSLSARAYNWKNLLISPGGAVYKLHVDDLGVHACVLPFSGRKRFVLYPPTQIENLHYGAVDPDAPDYRRFPKFANASERFEAVVNPGDVIFT